MGPRPPSLDSRYCSRAFVPNAHSHPTCLLCAKPHLACPRTSPFRWAFHSGAFWNTFLPPLGAPGWVSSVWSASCYKALRRLCISAGLPLCFPVPGGRDKACSAAPGPGYVPESPAELVETQISGSHSGRSDLKLCAGSRFCITREPHRQFWVASQPGSPGRPRSNLLCSGNLQATNEPDTLQPSLSEAPQLDTNTS